MATLKKIDENKPNPYGIDKGYTKRIKDNPEMPVVGQVFIFGSLMTSPVVEVLPQVDNKHFTFKTENSTYTVTLNN